MNQSNSNEGGNGNGGGSGVKQAVSWTTKVGYIGTGVLIGLIAYPFVRKAITKIQPKMDELLDSLTGRAEDLAERASDLVARAKDSLGRKDERKDAAKEDHSGHAHFHKEKDTTQ